MKSWLPLQWTATAGSKQQNQPQKANASQIQTSGGIITTSTAKSTLQNQVKNVIQQQTLINQLQTKVLESQQQQQSQPKIQEEHQDETLSHLSSDSNQNSSHELESNTTGNGDGLILRRNQPNIFEIISQIKQTQISDSDSDSDATPLQSSQADLMSSQDSRNSLFDLNIADINGELSPFAYLIEACKSLEHIKSQIRTQAEIENEFLQVTKSIKSGVDKVFTCSHTLKLLLQKFIQFTEQNEQMQVKITDLEKELFDHKQLLTEEKSVSSYLRKQAEQQQSRLKSLTAEKKRLDQRVEYLQSQQREQSKMQEAEYFKLIHDNSQMRQKYHDSQCAFAKSQVLVQQLQKYKDEQDEKNQRFEEQSIIELKIRTEEQTLIERQRRTFKGFAHFDILMSYLSQNEQVKVISICKDVRSQAILYCFTPLAQSFSLLSIKKHKLEEANQELEQKVKSFEIKTQARTQLLQNVNDQRLREIIAKHVIAPTLDQNVSKKNVVFEFEDILRQCKQLIQTHAQPFVTKSETTKLQPSSGSSATMFGMISKGMGSYLYGTSKKQDHAINQPLEQEQPPVLPLTADNLNKLQQQSQVPPQVAPEPIIQIEVEQFSYDELSQLLHKVSTSLVQDRGKLSRWIAGTQQGFAILLVWSIKLKSELKELDLLKEFFSSRIETLKLKISELLNEQEDLKCIQESDLGIKEHLLQRNRQLDNQLVILQTEYLTKSQKLSGIEFDRQEYEAQLQKERDESREIQIKSAAQVKVYRDKNKTLIKQNRIFRQALQEMTQFFNTTIAIDY